MLKTTGSSDELASSKKNGSRSASNRNNNSRPIFERNDGNGKVDGFSSDGVEHDKKSEKSKCQKFDKSQKLSKFQKSAKSGKKLSKSGNLSNFGAKKAGPSFLTPGAKETFNHLRLAFTKAPILWYCHPECHIWIEADVLGYAIGDMLS